MRIVVAYQKVCEIVIIFTNAMFLDKNSIQVNHLTRDVTSASILCLSPFGVYKKDIKIRSNVLCLPVDP